MKITTIKTIKNLINELIKITNNINSANKTIEPKYSKEIDKQDTKTTISVYERLTNNVNKSKRSILKYINEKN